MDFLDPKKKRSTAIRLATGHFFMALIVIFGTYLLVNLAYGYGVDRKTGQVIQNGLVFFDSAPDKAKIFLNGQEQEFQTNVRHSLAEGRYDIELRKDGYRSWKRNLNLEGGTVERLMYPLLIPSNLTASEAQTLDALPTLGLQSPDRRWVLTGQPGAFGSFAQYDLNNLKNDKPIASSVALPAGLLATNGDNHALSLVEWSNDNKHVLLKHTFSEGQEFVMLNRDDPVASVNINRLLNQNPTTIQLHDKQFDRLYLYTSAGGLLQMAELKNKTVTPLLSDVLNFKAHGSDMLLFAQPTPGDPTKARISLRNNAKSYTLRDIPLAQNIPLELATYDNNWFAVIGSDTEHKSYIYKNPLAFLKRKNSDRTTIPVSALKSTGPITEIAFSLNSHYIMVNNGQHFATYDVEQARYYNYDIKDAIEPGIKPVWMDGNRLVIRSGGKAIMFDYDGINQQTLQPNENGLPIFFDRDYKVLYTLSKSQVTVGKYGLLQTDLRLPADK
jgi:hypothetical protein